MVFKIAVLSCVCVFDFRYFACHTRMNVMVIKLHGFSYYMLSPLQKILSHCIIPLTLLNIFTFQCFHISQSSIQYQKNSPGFWGPQTRNG